MSYWINYAVSSDIKGTPSKQWQIPIGLQLVPAGLLGFGMFSLPESLRWHISRGEEEKAWDSLRWVRADSGHETREEFEEIKVGVGLELKQMEGLTAAGKSLIISKDLRR